MTALELRAAIDEVLSRVDSLAYALRIEQAACESATKSMHKYAEQAAVLAVQLGNARRIERRDVVMYLRAVQTPTTTMRIGRAISRLAPL